jgi:hypothetical protein
MLLTNPQQERQNWLARLLLPLPPLSIANINFALVCFRQQEYIPFAPAVQSFPLRQDILQPSRGAHEDIAKGFAYRTPAAKHLWALASTTRHHARRPVKIPANGGVGRSLAIQAPPFSQLVSLLVVDCETGRVSTAYAAL